MKKKKKLSLPVQIFIALVLGIVVGLVFYFTGAAGFTTSYIKPFGDIFVNLLKFIVVPVVLLSMIDGIISMGDMKKVGAVGWKTILYFMVTTAVACVIGLVLATVFNNAGLFPNLSEAAQAAEYEAKEYAGFMATLVAIFPTNMWKAFTEANMLHAHLTQLLQRAITTLIAVLQAADLVVGLLQALDRDTDTDLRELLAQVNDTIGEEAVRGNNDTVRLLVQFAHNILQVGTDERLAAGDVGEVHLRQFLDGFDADLLFRLGRCFITVAHGATSVAAVSNNDSTIQFLFVIVSHFSNTSISLFIYKPS